MAGSKKREVIATTRKHVLEVEKGPNGSNFECAESYVLDCRIAVQRTERNVGKRF